MAAMGLLCTLLANSNLPPDSVRGGGNCAFVHQDGEIEPCIFSKGKVNVFTLLLQATRSWTSGPLMQEPLLSSLQETCWMEQSVIRVYP